VSRNNSRTTTTQIVLFAAAKKKKLSPAAAALEKLQTTLETTGGSVLLDEPLSFKEQLELQKQQKPRASATLPLPAAAATAAATKSSRKGELLLKVLEMDLHDDNHATKQSQDGVDVSQLSKKEQKALQKKQEKLAEKAEKKKHNKMDPERIVDEEGPAIKASTIHNIAEIPVVDQGEQFEEVTLEDKIRRERPPPRVRVMESSQPGYTSLRLENVGITFRNQEVVKDVTWGVQTGDRIGLVGKNGAGKTTQIRILAGELEPTTGDVVKSSKDLRTAVLRQEFVDELVPERTLREEFLSVFVEENAILDEIKAAEKALENTPADDADTMQKILDRMQELQNKAENKEVYALESRVKKVMDLMGFTEDEGEDLVASFSGGWKMRLGLGKVLLKDPNVLLLDEPTNHLDLESVEWLESFLRQQNIPMVIVSHDREFLDQVCTKIVDAEGGICTEYEGNYSRFLLLKKAKMEAWQATYDAQEKRIKEEKAWIQKFKVKQPQAVKQRQAKIEKLIKSKDYVPKPPFTGKPFKFRFPEGPRLSPEVAQVKGMSHGYRNEVSQNRLFDNVDLFIEKGDRIAVLGPNGSGKSTLLRLLVGKEKPDEGSAGLIGANVVMNYFEQNQADALDLDKNPLETVQAASNGQTYNELRAYLGQFLFKGDDVEKKVRTLSGGEKARLSLCCMMLRPANFLILDEPTNHLDIPAKEMLEEALQFYPGSVMIVSHDRYFVSKVATTIVAVENKQLVKYPGDYKSYMEKSDYIKEKVEARYVSGVSRIEAAPVFDLEEIVKPKRAFGGAPTAHLVTRPDKGIKNAKRMQN
jgi:ATP-binding cassette, subfamily F, member 3